MHFLLSIIYFVRLMLFLNFLFISFFFCLYACAFILFFFLFLSAGQEGLEPPTPGFGDRCSTN